MKLRAAAAVFSLISISVFSILITGPIGSEPVYWPGWYILKITQETDETALIEELGRAGVPGALGASNARVSFMGIPRLESVPLDGLDQVLLPGDPRRDPWLLSAASLFRSGGSRLVYLPADRSLREYRNMLREIPDGTDALLMDRQPRFFWADSVLYILAALLISFVLGGRRTRLVRAAAMIPPAVLMLFAGPGTLLPLLLAFAFSPSLIWENRRVLGAPRAAAALTGFALSLAVLFRGAGSAYPLSVLFALIASEAVVLIQLRCRVTAAGAGSGRGSKRGKITPPLRLRRRDHRLFDPVSLLKPVSRPVKVPLRFYGAIPVLFLLAAGALLPDRNRPEHPPVPSARTAVSGFDSLTAIRSLDDQRTAASLPDISLLLSSAAYQEGFMYGAAFRLPIPGEVLSIRSYGGDGPVIAAGESVLFRYDAEWFAAATERVLSEGAGRLFASLGGPAPVQSAVRPPAAETKRSASVEIGLSGIAYLLLVLITFIPRQRDSFRNGAAFRPITIRRREQAA